MNARVSLGLALALTGCQFAPSQRADAPGGAADGASPDRDGGTTVDADRASPDATTPPDARPPTCPPGNGLQLCLTFEGLPAGPAPATIADASSAGATVTLSNASIVVDASRGSQALGLTGMSRVVTSPVVALGATASIETWVRVDQEPPTGQRMGVLDDAAEYSLFYYHDSSASGGRRWRCAIGPSFFGPDDGAAVGAWTHLACVCNQGLATLYVNGSPVATGTCDPIDVSRPVALGADRDEDGVTSEFLTGRLDDVRLWSRVLTPAEVCAAAGRTTCP